MLYRGYYTLLFTLFITTILLAGCEQSNASLKQDEVLQQTDPYSTDGLDSSLWTLSHITEHYTTPLFKNPLTENLIVDDMVVLAFYESGKELITESYNSDWLTTMSGHGLTYLPKWYMSDMATKSEMIEPISLQVKASTVLHLFPDSDAKWTYEQIRQTYKYTGDNGISNLLSLFRYNDWYGFILSPSSNYDEHIIHKPLLLWVHKTEVVNIEKVATPIFTSKLDITIDKVREITETLLLKGIPKHMVQTILGEPHVIEASRNMNTTGDRLRVGELWRYEHAHAHFTVTMYDEVVEEWEWHIPITEAKQLDVAIDQYPYGYNYHFRAYPIVPTLSHDVEWRHQGNLEQAFLWEGTDDVLLIRGHDDGFSGMHYDSNVYALERATGKKLWQIDAGHTGVDLVVSADREHAAILTRFDINTSQYMHQLQYIQLLSGEVLWEKTWDASDEWYRMTGSKNSLILYSQPTDKNNGKLNVLNMATGDMNWLRTFTDTFQIVNEGFGEPYVMVQQGLSIVAYHSLTGHKQWAIHRESSSEPEHHRVSSDAFHDMPVNAFEKEQNSHWLLLGSELLHFNLKTGELLDLYAVKMGETIYRLSNQYLLIQNSTDSANMEQVKTSLYDVANKTLLWTLPGRGYSGLIEDEVLYINMNGKPIAVSIHDGQIIWETTSQAPFEGRGCYFCDSLVILEDYIILPFATDLLLMRKADGVIEGRLHNIRFGTPDLYDEKRVRLLNVDDDFMYVGSSNGGFIKVNINDRLDR